MEYVLPDYYWDFQCLADSCPRTCCAGWGIAIDQTSLKKYRRYKGGFGNRLHNSIDWREGTFYQYQGRCTFLNDSNLCDIYAEAGSGMLCKTCRRYPRHYEEYENLREISLSLSCPEAARLILERQDTVRFVTAYRQTREEEYGDFDVLLFSKLLDIREVLFQIVQNRDFFIRQRMALVLALGEEVQKKVDAGGIFEIDESLQRYRVFCENKTAAEAYIQRWRKRQNEGTADLLWEKKKAFCFLYEMENLDKDWRPFLDKCERILYQREADYQRLCRRYQRCNSGYEIQMEQLLVYFLFTYFAGSVYDGRLLDKVKLSVAHVELIQELCTAICAEKGSQFTGQDILQLVCRYARELEHSDRNLEAMERLAGRESCFFVDISGGQC